MMRISFDLERFTRAQNPVFEQVKAELREGCKRSHWMWFIFPQLAGLGRSEMAQRFAIASLAEAEAYLRHDVLGPRLIECTDLVNHVHGRSVHEIFGAPDDLKFQSCMTLFAQLPSKPAPFDRALQTYFGGRSDDATIELLKGGAP